MFVKTKTAIHFYLRDSFQTDGLGYSGLSAQTDWHCQTSHVSRFFQTPDQLNYGYEPVTIAITRFYFTSISSLYDRLASRGYNLRTRGFLHFPGHRTFFDGFTNEPLTSKFPRLAELASSLMYTVVKYLISYCGRPLWRMEPTS